MKFTWKKNGKQTGLRAVAVVGPRGSKLRLDGEEVGSVSVFCVNTREWSGWYWVAFHNPLLHIEYKNSCDTPAQTEEEAKAQCEAYIRKCLNLPPKKEKKNAVRA